MNFDSDDEDAGQNEYYSAFPPSVHAWLYIAIDIRDMGIAKIGLTTQRTPHMRVSEGKTYNPFLALFSTWELSKCTYGVSFKELLDLESYVHRRAALGKPIKHLHTRRNSEWFYIHPEEAEFQMDWIIAKRALAIDGKHLYTNYEGKNNSHGIHVPRMRKIKKIFRPHPDDFSITAETSEIPYHYYRDYHNFLVNYHQRPSDEKIY